MIKILFLAANPVDMAPLQLDEEIRAIDAELQSSALRNSFTLNSHWAVRADDLQKLLLRYRPQIVHFSGHGSAASELVVQDDSGHGVPIPPAALSELFRLLKDNVRCVVLNACYSEPQARAIAEYIDVVIGMADEIGNKNSVQFAAAFYRALAENKDVQAAFDLGRNAIQLHDQGGGGDHAVPQLLERPGVDAAQISVGAGLLHSDDHYVWAFLTVVALAVVLHFAAQMVLRWLPVDPNLFTSSAQTITTAFVIVSVLGGLGSEWGRTAVRRLWEKITNRYPRLQHTRVLFVATALLAVVFATGFYVATPRLAAQSAEAGLEALEAGRRNDALDAFRQAARMEPDNACHQFNLGLAYELGLGPDNEQLAIAAYERAKDLDEHFLPTYNNLGRLYLKNDETEAAQGLLQTGTDQLDRMDGQPGVCVVDADQQMLHRGIFYKNLAHAYLLGGSPTVAERHLNEAAKALSAYDEIVPGVTAIYWAELHSLRAKALAAKGQCEAAKSAWLDSEGYARSIPGSQPCRDHGGLGNPQCADAENWIAAAEQGLAEPCDSP